MNKFYWCVLLIITMACGVDSSTSPPTDNIPQPTITITFDDGYENVYTYAYPILTSYDIPANVAIFTDIWSDSSNWPNRLSLSQTKKLHNAGWSIVSHSVSHPNLLSISLDSVFFELTESKRILDSLQFHSPDVFIVPYMLIDADVLHQIQLVYASARCCVQSMWSGDTLIELPTPHTNDDWYELVAVDVSNYSTDNDQTYNFTTESGRNNLRMILNDAVSANKFIDIVFHDINASDTTSLKQTLDIISEFKPYVQTYNQIIK